MSLDLTDEKSTLVQVMAWCRQAPSHYLSQCWPRSMSPYDVTRPQWVNVLTKQLLHGSGLLCLPAHIHVKLQATHAAVVRRSQRLVGHEFTEVPLHADDACVVLGGRHGLKHVQWSIPQMTLGSLTKFKFDTNLICSHVNSNISCSLQTFAQSYHNLDNSAFKILSKDFDFTGHSVPQFSKCWWTNGNLARPQHIVYYDDKKFSRNFARHLDQFRRDFCWTGLISYVFGPRSGSYFEDCNGVLFNCVAMSVYTHAPAVVKVKKVNRSMDWPEKYSTR